MTTTCTVCELHAESTFKVEGMDCREEVALLERRFKNLAGLEDFSADLMGQRLHVKYDAAQLSTSTIAAAVADAGMRAWLEHEEPLAGTPPAERMRRSLVWISGAALALGLVLECVRRRRRRAGVALRRVDRRGHPGRRPPRLAVRCAPASLDINVLMLDRRGRRDRRCGSGPKPPPSSSCSPSRRRSKRGRSSARATRSAR